MWDLSGIYFFAGVTAGLALWTLGGGRFVSRLSHGLKCAGGSASRLMSSIVNIVARRLRSNGGVTVRKFNAFRIGGGLREVSVGPTARRHVLVPPGLILACGPDMALGRGFGWGDPCLWCCRRQRDGRAECRQAFN